MTGSPALPWPAGFRLLPGHLDEEAAAALLEQVRQVAEAAPFFTPTMPRSGAPLSVRMTNAGPLGWVSDVKGYRYEEIHPLTGRPWPAIPPAALALWRALAPDPRAPQCCLVNLYQGSAVKMGLHRDQDEAAADAPILNISLGDDAMFALGGAARRDPVRRFRITGGTVMVFAGAARHVHHGVDRVLAGTSPLLRRGGFGEGGRISLTLRRVTP
jgi:alkylated DNA repair protein (DNA oxidative demethylase)